MFDKNNIDDIYKTFDRKDEKAERTRRIARSKRVRQPRNKVAKS